MKIRSSGVPNNESIYSFIHFQFLHYHGQGYGVSEQLLG